MNPTITQVVKLGSLGVFLKGQGIRRTDVQSTGVACLRYGEIYTRFDDYTDGLVSHVSAEVAATAIRLRKGDVVFAGSGETKAEIGKCTAWVGDTDAVVGGDTIVLRGHGQDAVFLASLLNTAPVARQKAARGQGDAVVHISARALSDIDITLPPLAVQTNVSGTIRDADSLIASLERLIAKKQAIKQGMMQQLLTGKTRLNGFNQEWDWQPFTAVMIRLNTRKHQILASSYSAVGILPVVDQGKNLIIGYTNQIDAACEPGNGGVVVFGDHTCITKFVDFTFVVGADGTQLVKANGANSTRFMAYALEMDPVQSTGYNRHYKLLQEKILPVPSRLEQDAITRLLMDTDAEIEGLNTRLTKAKAIKQGMMQELLTGRTRLSVMESAS